MKKRRCPSVLYTKEEKSTRFAGASINLSGRHANNSHGAKLRTQFVTSRICSLWRWFWRKFKREFYLQTSALIFSKIALRKDIRAQNDLCVDQLETSTSPPPRVKSGHLNFWRLDHSNSSPLGPKECSNDLFNDRISPSGAVVGSCRLLWILCMNMPTIVSWLVTWYCRLQKQNFIVETNFIVENLFSSVKFCESLYTSWQRCFLHDIIFWQNFIEGFLFLIKNRKL